MRVLVTGFNAFGEVGVNPAQGVVEAMRGRGGEGYEGTFAVLETAYGAAEGRLRALIGEVGPELVVMLGVADGAPCVVLERVATNLDDCEFADNAGEVRVGREIVAGGASAYRTRAPVEALMRRLLREGFEVLVSDHAGGFLCNHAYYVACHETRGSGAACLFVHVPMPQGAGYRGGAGAVTFGRLVETVAACVRGLVEEMGGG